MSFKEKEFHKEENCLNCGYPLIGKYCAHCGQKAFLHKDSFWHMVVHFAGDYFHYDNKFWTTLKALFLKPGLITLEYINGKRARYLNPIQLYIFVSTLFFLVFLSSEKESQPAKKNNTHRTQNTPARLDSNSDTTLFDAIEQSIDSSRYSDNKEDKPAKIQLVEPFKKGNSKKGSSQSTYESLIDYDTQQHNLPEIERDGFIQRYFIRKYYSIKDRYPDDHAFGEVYIEKIKHNVPKAFFLLLPVFALLLKLLFRRKDRYYVDHVIFSIHFHSFIFMLFLIPAIIDKLFHLDDVVYWLNVIFTFGIGVYLYMALKYVYPSVTWKRIIKQVLLTFAYFVCFILTSIVMLLITVILI